MEQILRIENLHTSFYTHAGEVKAVRGVNIRLSKGEIIGIVGESGCGKSVTMMSMLGLIPENAKVKEGCVFFQDKELTKLTDQQLENIRGNEISMIFQDPMTSLNPVFTIGNQMTEHVIKHKKIGKKEAWNLAVEMLEKVGISNPGQRMKQYPHEFSGGMRQRVMIAMALITNPKLIIADEPTTALDVTIQAQILELLKAIRDEFCTSIILITHDLGVVADMCDRVYVMYGGTIVESGNTEDIFYRGRHPYGWGLLGSVPNPAEDTKERLKPISGQPPDLIQPPLGCPFSARCRYAMNICETYMPVMEQVSDTQHTACWLLHPMAAPSDGNTGKAVI